MSRQGVPGRNDQILTKMVSQRTISFTVIADAGIFEMQPRIDEIAREPPRYTLDPVYEPGSGAG